MIRHSFFWKLYLSYAVLVLVSATVIGLLVLGNLRRNALRDAESNLFNTASLLASLEAANPAHLWSGQLGRQIAEVAGETGLHLTLLFANGTLAAGSSPTSAIRPLEVLELPEFRAARRARSGQAIRSPDTGLPEHLLLAVPILLEYEIIGYVRVGVPLDRLEARQDELRDRVLAGTSVNAIIALGLGFFFARYTTRPLADIGTICRRLAAGNFAERIRLRRHDEIGVVAQTINHMAGEVQQRIHDETRERHRLAALLAVMADGVVAVSARETIAYVNDVAARLLALENPATGKPFRAQVRLAAVREIYEAALASGVREVREVRVTAHPQEMVLRVDATPLRDPAGGPFGVLLVLHDLTAIRRLEDMRRTFTANVSHELKTPLTAIGALVDTLIESAAMDPTTRRRFLVKIRDQNERLYGLVQDLLILAKLESEGPTLETRPIDLGPLLGECVETFSEIARSKDVAIAWSPPEGPLIVPGNDEALRLVFNNLLHNAVSYTPGGGTVTVTTGTADGQVTVAIQDTGVGIEPQHLERIFERFYRVDRGRARQDGGSGLGLSIVKHLVQALDGRVVVESVPGQGSTFAVQLPLASGAAAPAATLQLNRE
jgi:two-component system phosphate regulon sensor histidine kinase PhoR